MFVSRLQMSSWDFRQTSSKTQALVNISENLDVVNEAQTSDGNCLRGFRFLFM